MDWLLESLFYPSFLILLINFSKLHTTEPVDTLTFFWSLRACFLNNLQLELPGLPTERKTSLSSSQPPAPNKTGQKVKRHYY